MGCLNRIKNWPELIAKAHYHINDLAGLCHVQPSSIQRFFLKRFQATPLVCFKRLRLAKAAGLLQNGSLSVKEVSALCDYDSSPLFCRQFKQLFGVRPSEAVEIDPGLLQGLKTDADKLNEPGSRPG